MISNLFLLLFLGFQFANAQIGIQGIQTLTPNMKIIGIGVNHDLSQTYNILDVEAIYRSENLKFKLIMNAHSDLCINSNYNQPNVTEGVNSFNAGIGMGYAIVNDEDMVIGLIGTFGGAFYGSNLEFKEVNGNTVGGKVVIIMTNEDLDVDNALSFELKKVIGENFKIINVKMEFPFTEKWSFESKFQGVLGETKNTNEYQDNMNLEQSIFYQIPGTRNVKIGGTYRVMNISSLSSKNYFGCTLKINLK
jgi:hypothetical protein